MSWAGLERCRRRAAAIMENPARFRRAQGDNDNNGHGATRPAAPSSRDAAGRKKALSEPMAARAQAGTSEKESRHGGTRWKPATARPASIICLSATRDRRTTSDFLYGIESMAPREMSAPATTSSSTRGGNRDVVTVMASLGGGDVVRSMLVSENGATTK